MITDPASVDWRNPDYPAIFRARLEVLERLRAEPALLPDFRTHYRENPADFISDWGVTYEPRNAERGLPTYIPFVLFRRQREWVEWVVEHWRAGTPGMTEKSRDSGLSWLTMALSCTLCIFNDGVAIGVGSRKTEYVDKIGALKPLLPKARLFMECLPVEFRGRWVAWRDAPYMRITFPDTGSFIGGEGGDELGRGDRTSIFIVDEYAFFERPDLTERALSQTTNCRIDVSSVNGMDNVFAQKAHSGKVDVFQFAWQDDPRKDEFWYNALSLPTDQFVERLDGTKIYGKGLDPVTIAQEVNRDYMASVEGVVIPGAWILAAIDAHQKLGIAPAGKLGMSLDVADEGKDKNAACVSRGTSIERSHEWSGEGSDIFGTVQRAFDICDEHGIDEFDYDSDGLGAGVRGDARVINDQREAQGRAPVRAVGFRGSEAVHDPDGIVEGTMGRDGDQGRMNKDYFANRKAQGWWSLRRRFQRTYRWVVEGIACSPDEIINIDSSCPNHKRLAAELGQPTYKVNGVGKIIIDKQPGGTKSPNLGDCTMIRYAPKDLPSVRFTRDVIAKLARAPGRRPIGG